MTQEMTYEATHWGKCSVQPNPHTQHGPHICADWRPFYDKVPVHVCGPWRAFITEVCTICGEEKE